MENVVGEKESPEPHLGNNEGLSLYEPCECTKFALDCVNRTASRNNYAVVAVKDLTF